MGGRGITKNVFFAIKEIKEGEKLTFDYNWVSDKNKRKTECKCGTANCRRFIEKYKTC